MPVLSTAAGSELWEATCTPFVNADCPPDTSVDVGTYLGHPSVVDFIENDSDNGVVDHYAFLTVDPEPSDGVFGTGFRRSVCLNNASRLWSPGIMEYCPNVLALQDNKCSVTKCALFLNGKVFFRRTKPLSHFCMFGLPI